MVVQWGIWHPCHIPILATNSVKQTRTIFWVQIFSWDLNIWNSNLLGEDLWERKQKETYCRLRTSVMLLGYKKQKPELWDTALSSLKPNQTYSILKIPLPLVLNVCLPQGSERSEHWSGVHCSRLVMPTGQTDGSWGMLGEGRGEGLSTLGSSLGDLWMALGKWGILLLSHFFFFKSTCHLVLKRIESNMLFH